MLKHGLKPQLIKRDFSAGLRLPGLTYKVNSLEWDVLGGCRAASITALGEEMALWELMETLRCGIEIRDQWGEAAWWGFMGEARIRVNALEMGATIDSMINALAVAYSYVAPGTQDVGERKTTAWATDSTSITEYGRKELLSSMDGLSDAAALARRDAILAARKWPQGTAGQFGAKRGSRGKRLVSASLYCRGWSDTLRWRYASVASVSGPSYTATSATEQNVGETSANIKVVQGFVVASQAVNALQIKVYARKQGSPVDNLKLELYELDADGAPIGSALGTATIAGSGLGASLAWITGTLASETQLQATTVFGPHFGLQVSRSGAADAANYYVINVNTALGYAYGVFKIWNGSAWVDRSPDADMPFELMVNNAVESTEQIRDLATTYGQFITGIDIDAGSGVILPSYRDGDTDSLQEILALLECGGANDRRLIYEIDVNRRLHVWEEPASTTLDYHLNTDGKLLDKFHRPVKEYQPSVGVWCSLMDVVPASVDMTRLISPELQFIESAAWSESQGLQLRFRGQPSVEDMFQVKND